MSSTDTFAAIPPEKRGLIYDVFDVLDPLATTQEARKARKIIGEGALLISRILKHYDEVEQLAKVYFCFSQSMIGPNIKGNFTTQDIASDEHMAVTSTLAKDEATGAITITYTEPEGFPVHFHWTATVALDGTVTSTPIVIE